MELGIAIAIGLIGSLHCVAMCGPLIVALPAPGAAAGRFLLGRVLYQLGRILTYCILGVIAGGLGHAVALAGWQRALSLVLGASLLIGFMISKRVALSAPVLRLVGFLRNLMSAQFRRRGLQAHFILGTLNGLLPCGLVYVALAGATAQGTALKSLAYMAAFGLGTVPALLGIALSGRMFPPAWRLKFRPAIPLGILLLSGVLILRGLALGIPYLSPGVAAGAPVCCAR